MNRITIFILIFSVSALGLNPAMAYDFNKSIREKQAAKNAKRWSLTDWLAQKDRNKLMDMWLFYNTPSPYEFFFSADTSTIESSSTPIGGTPTVNTYRNYRGALGAYVTMVGLYGEYETSDEELEQWKANFMLRLLGSSDQSTNLTVHYGLMNQNFNNEEAQYQVAGARLNLYIMKPFALTGQYEHIFKSTSDLDVERQGQRMEAGAHIEYGAFRIYGTWYQETMDELNLTTNLESQRKREGILYGLRFYF